MVTVSFVTLGGTISKRDWVAMSSVADDGFTDTVPSFCKRRSNSWSFVGLALWRVRDRSRCSSSQCSRWSCLLSARIWMRMTTWTSWSVCVSQKCASLRSCPSDSEHPTSTTKVGKHDAYCRVFFGLNAPSGSFDLFECLLAIRPDPIKKKSCREIPIIRHCSRNSPWNSLAAISWCGPTNFMIKFWDGRSWSMRIMGNL